MAQAITATISVARLHLARSSRVACPSPLLPSLPWCWQKQIAKAISMYLSSQGRPHMHTPLAATPRNYGSACEPHCGFATGKLSSIWPSVCECVCSLANGHIVNMYWNSLKLLMLKAFTVTSGRLGQRQKEGGRQGGAATRMTAGSSSWCQTQKWFAYSLLFCLVFCIATRKNISQNINMNFTFEIWVCQARGVKEREREKERETVQPF